MNQLQPYDFSQHFMHCARWKKIFENVASKIASAIECDSYNVKFVHYGEFCKDSEVLERHPLKVMSTNAIAVAYCTLDFQIDHAICMVNEAFSKFFPLVFGVMPAIEDLRPAIYCVSMRFSGLDGNECVLLFPCNLFLPWKNDVNKFLLSSLCRADLSKDRLNARHVRLSAVDIETRILLGKFHMSIDDLKHLRSGDVLMLQRLKLLT